MEPISPDHPHVIYEGFLHKTPPLDKLFVSWKRKWVVLCQTDPINTCSVELRYYNDPMKQEATRSIPLSKVVKIRPSYGKSKDTSFAIELKEYTFLLKAPDRVSKDIWLAKLCELSSKDPTFHVSVPYQPAAQASEASVKLATPRTVMVASPSTGKPILEIPFNRIRRFGYEVLYGVDVVWFESCECNGKEQEDFIYFVVKSGMAAAFQIVHEYKSKIEQATGSFLILEKSEDTEISYKARAHYGHKDYPDLIRARILQAGLCGLAKSWPMGIRGGRRQSEFSHSAASLSSDKGRRNTVQTVLLGNGGTRLSRTPSPAPPRSPTVSKNPSYPSPTSSPNHSGDRLTLNQMTVRPARMSNGSHGSKSDQFDSGITLDTFDEARHSAPSYVSMAPAPSVQRDIQKGKTSYSPPSQHKPSLHEFSQQHVKTFDSSSPSCPPPLPSRTTLDRLSDRVKATNLGNSPSRTFPSKDSNLGTSADADLDEYEPMSLANGYGNSRNSYDHLAEKRVRKLSPAVPPRSLRSLGESPYSDF